VDIDPRATVSPHFTWGELTRTDSRDPEILAAQDHPSDEIGANLLWLARTLLEPIHDVVGRLRVNSGYRSPALNASLAGASRTSQHMHGLAADVVPMDMALVDAYELIIRVRPWALDQLIFEWGRWIHIGAPVPGGQARNQHLMIFGPGHYEMWNPDDERVTALREDK
jgi:zinc D-Ala-D-Ala carboxypeptidase